MFGKNHIHTNIFFLQFWGLKQFSLRGIIFFSKSIDKKISNREKIVGKTSNNE